MLLSRLAGLTRDAVIASRFGARGSTDALFAAFTIPDLVSSLLLAGLVGVAFIPVFVRVRADDENRAAALASGIFNLLAIGTAVIALAGVLAAGPAIALIAPGLPPASSELAAALLRIMLPALVLFGLGSLLTGVLNADERFLLPTLAGLVLNLAIILAALTLAQLLGLFAIAWGFLAGSILQFCLQAWGAHAGGHRWQPTLALGAPELRMVVLAAIPLVLVTACQYGRLVVERVIGSTLPPGTISELGFANRVLLMPATLAAGPIATALFPRLSVQSALSADADFHRSVVLGIRLIVLVALPGALLLAMLSTPLVAVLYQRGAFTAAASAGTGDLLAIFALGLPAIAVNEFLTRGCFASGRARFALLITASALAVNVAADVVLARLLGAPGLAAGAVIAAWASTLALATAFAPWKDAAMAASALKLALAAVPSAAVAWLVHAAFAGPELLRVALALIAAGAVYAAALLALHAEELQLARRSLASRWVR